MKHVHCTRHDIIESKFTCTVPSQKKANGWCTLHWAKIGGWADIEVSVSCLCAKERPGSTILSIVAVVTIDFNLIQARLPIQSKGGRDTSPYVVECSCIKWAWLPSLAVYDGLFMLKRGIKPARLSFTAV